MLRIQIGVGTRVQVQVLVKKGLDKCDCVMLFNLSLLATTNQILSK